MSFIPCGPVAISLPQTTSELSSTVPSPSGKRSSARASSATCSPYQRLMRKNFSLAIGSLPSSLWAISSWLFWLMPGSQRKYHFSPPWPNWKVTMRVSWHDRASAMKSNIMPTRAGALSSARTFRPCSDASGSVDWIAAPGGWTAVQWGGRLGSGSRVAPSRFSISRRAVCARPASPDRVCPARAATS